LLRRDLLQAVPEAGPLPQFAGVSPLPPVSLRNSRLQFVVLRHHHSVYPANQRGTPEVQDPMAQAATKKRKKASSAKKGSAKKSAAKKSAAKKTAAKTAKKAAKKAPSPVDAAANAALASKAAAEGTRAAGKAVSLAVSRAKVPLITGASAAAGLAGGIAVINRRKGKKRRRSGTGLDAVVAAARRAGTVGEEISHVASAIQEQGKKND
jgi:hypothetical protein